MSDEADPLYRPLGGIGPWATAPVDHGAWALAVGRLRALRTEEPDWSDMVGRGALLAAAHQSGAVDAMHAADGAVARSLLRGAATLASVGEDARAHVRANYEALRLARDGVGVVSEASVRRIHEVACRPQPTHRARVGRQVQDHVLAGGDYKHHPNHARRANGDWQPTAPVPQVRPEMARLVEVVGSTGFSGLHPVAQAAYVHHALLHVQPFADGNGRVARALAGGFLLRAASIPFLVWAEDATAGKEEASPAALVEIVHRTGLGLVDLLTSSDQDPAALARWRERAGAAASVRAALPAAVARALDRPSPGRWSDLSGAAVTASGGRLVIRVPIEHGPTVDEVLSVDAHPLEGDGVVLTADEAMLRLEARPGDDAPLGPWLERVVSCLALRVAAELE